MARGINVVAVIAGVALAGSLGCTTKTNAPPLTGPSELALSIAVYANPDSLPRQGGAQSQITIQARDARNQPIANLPVRLATLGLDAAGSVIPGDVGQLSTGQVVTDAGGRAAAYYATPNAPADALVSVKILAAPSGSDANGALDRSVTILLTAPVIANPPKAKFTFLPDAPTGTQRVFFDASGSTGPNAITNYAWDFGDSQTSAGNSPTVDHSFLGCTGAPSAATSTFVVRLTVTDSMGQTSTIAQSVPVAQCK